MIKWWEAMREMLGRAQLSLRGGKVTGRKEMMGGKMMEAKETGGKAMGVKAPGAKAPGAQDSQETGGKSDMLMSEGLVYRSPNINEEDNTEFKML